MKNLLLKVTAFILLSLSVNADCIYGAKDKSSFVVLDSHSILLKGGYGSEILIKTYCYIYSTPSVQILKDSFCDYESSVMYIDGEVCDANQVKKL
jgi:hypothetical protein